MKKLTTDFPHALFITWTTYGTWLPGDMRGWTKWKSGLKEPQPNLENWTHSKLVTNTVVLNSSQRQKVEKICHRHADIREWKMHAINVRSNHIHVVVTANHDPKKVRDQLKANATRVLRESPNEISNGKIWSRGGDIQFLDDDNDLVQVVEYV